MSRWLVAMVALAGWAGSVVVGQDPGRQPERLFRSRTPLELTLRAPFNDLFKNRDTLNDQSIAGTIELVDERQGAVALPVTLQTRGHFRLRRITCGFAPLKVTFDKEKAKGSVFSSQGGIKLVTHCQSPERYQQNLLIEEAIYRMYNQLTPLSHRTRLARIRYLPTTDTTKAVIRYGFFIEDDDEMGKRNSGKVVMQTGGTFNQMDPAQMDLVAMFQYLIGNTDWSVFAIHNIRVLEMPGDYYQPVAYDFDFSGLVNSQYAAPDQRLPIKSVRDRLYRGPCRKKEELAPTLERFRMAKDSLYAQITGMPDLEPKRAKEAIEYLDGFYERFRGPKDLDGALGYACR